MGKLFSLATAAEKFYAVLIGVVLLLGAATATVLYLEHRGARQELAKLQKSSAENDRKAQAKINQQNVDHAKDEAANKEQRDHDAETIASLRAGLANSVQGFDAYRQTHGGVARPTGQPGPAEPGECGSRSCGDLASQLVRSGNDTAGSVADVSADLRACQRDRDALNGLPR